LLGTGCTGCATTSQQQPPQAATSAVNGDQYHGDFAGSGPNARQPDPAGTDQFAGTSARSRQIEKDLGVQ